MLICALLASKCLGQTNLDNVRIFRVFGTSLFRPDVHWGRRGFPNITIDKMFHQFREFYPHENVGKQWTFSMRGGGGINRIP